MGADSGEWHATTDPTRVRQWADEHDAVPVRDPDEDGGTGLDVVTPQAQPSGEAAADLERIPWDQFLELFEAEQLAFRYRATDPDGVEPSCRLVDRSEVEETATEAETSGSSAQSVSSDQIVASDTGDAEPVVEDRVENQGDSATSPISRDELEQRGDQSPKRVDETGSPDAPTSESAGDAAEQPLVLEEIYEDPGGLGSDPEDEYVVFRNDGDERLDLSGWRVENGLGESYEFPDGFVLAPNEQVTIHSGEGRDSEIDLYWRSDETVWDRQGGTVVVRSPDGQRVLREPYKDG